MLPHEHIAISTIALPTAAALIGRRHAALFWISAVLVDVDHYIWFVGASGSWRPTGALRFFRQHYHDPAGRHAPPASAARFPLLGARMVALRLAPLGSPPSGRLPPGWPSIGCSTCSTGSYGERRRRDVRRRGEDARNAGMRFHACASGPSGALVTDHQPHYPASAGSTTRGRAGAERSARCLHVVNEQYRLPLKRRAVRPRAEGALHVHPACAGRQPHLWRCIADAGQRLVRARETDLRSQRASEEGGRCRATLSSAGRVLRHGYDHVGGAAAGDPRIGEEPRQRPGQVGPPAVLEPLDGRA